jgi:hypothetical protein
MKLIITLLLALIAPPILHAEIVNVAGRGTAFSNSDLFGGASIYRLIDGNRLNTIHLDELPWPDAAYTVDLGANYAVTEIRIFPRQDGCCPERLQNFRVSVHQDNAGMIGTEIWGANMFTDGSHAPSGAGAVVEIPLPSPQNGRWVQVKSLESVVPDYALQMTELEIYADVPPSEVNRALNALATSNRPLWNGISPAVLVDGNRSAAGNQVLHGLADIESPFFYEINMGVAVNLSRIVIWPRQDGCCADRLSNYRVSVHQDENGQIGEAVWSADMRTDFSNPGSAPGDRELITPNLDPAGNFQGQWIRIESLDESPIPNYALQMVEVEAFGEPLGAASLLITAQPRDTAAAPGQTATFSVGANLPGGDSSQIGYQWQKDGQNISGATEAEYTTPPLLSGDDKSVYRVVISYPGLPNQTSAEAILRINLAFQAAAYTNRPLWGPGGWNIDKLVNGDRTDVFHLDVEPEPGAAYEIDLGAMIQFEEIAIWPRQDGCCPERLSEFRVSVHTDANGAIGDQVWSADYFMDGSNPGASAGNVVRIVASDNPEGNFEGQWIRILSLEDPVQNYALQMTELEAYGTFSSPEPVLSVAIEPADYGTAPGRVANFSVTARLLNGDPAQIQYQWRKNGAAIPGATSASYSTPPVMEADEGAKYSVVLSFPGLAEIVSREAVLSFDYNYAKGQPAYTNQPLWGPGGWNINMLTDGNRLGVFHLDVTPAAGAAYEVDLGADVNLEKISIHPRQDGCCPERFTNLRVSVHQDSNGAIGESVWSTDIFTDGTNPGSGAGIVVDLTSESDPGGTFRGQWVRIQSLDDPVGDYALQMTELEVYGKLATPLVLPPTVAITRTEATVTLTWDGGTLESATEVTGPFQSVPDATSPYQTSLEGTQRYYRVRQP